MTLKPKGWTNLGPKTPIQWIYREWVKKLSLISQTTSKVDSDDKKMNIYWFNLKKIVLGTIREDQFLYIYSQVWLQIQFLMATVFFSQFPDPPSSGSSFCFILSSLFPLYPPRVGLIAGIDPCPISTFLKSLIIAVRLKITMQVSPPH